MRTATPHKIAATVDSLHMNYGHEDEVGRTFEHYGFFDKKHRHSGKTMNEVLVSEFKDRRTTDDDLEILHIFNNTPIEVGISGIYDVIGSTDSVNINEFINRIILNFQLKFNVIIRMC
jgi:hypothetical protein